MTFSSKLVTICPSVSARKLNSGVRTESQDITWISYHWLQVERAHVQDWASRDPFL